MGDSQRRRKVLAASIGLNLALFAALAFFFRQATRSPEQRKEDAQAALLANTAMRAELLQELAKKVSGIYDSHVDADVGRVLLAGIDPSIVRGEGVASNRFGMREREYELPKPPGTVRIVLLGDSLVFGVKVRAEERVGAYLETLLRERLGAGAPPLEVLHLAIASWNIGNECAFLRRQIGLLQPDLVVHVLTDNDLDDALGVRGVGVPAAFSPARRARGEARVSQVQRVPGGSRLFTNPLLLGLDLESRERMAEAQTAIADLRRQLEACGCAYVPLLYYPWHAVAQLREAYLPPDLRAGALCLRADFADDVENHVSDEDAHWSPTGARRLAEALYGWMQAARVPSELELPAFAPATSACASVLATGTDVGAIDPLDLLRGFEHVDAELVTAELAAGEAEHVYTGLGAGEVLYPYASFVLAPPASGSALVLEIEGEALGRPELEGLAVRVSVEGEVLASFILPREGAIRERFALPDALAARPLVNVRLEAPDHVLLGPHLQQCGVLRLVHLALARS